MDKLTEIRKRHGAATPGPWEWRERWNEVVSVTMNGAIVGKIHQTNENGHGLNGEFIARAWVDVQYLLQLVETQAKALEWYADEENYEQQWKDHGYWSDPEIDDDRGQRAREALTQV